jgi:hypothetical protein
VHQDGERLTVAPTGLLDEVSIHLDLQVPGLYEPGSLTMTVDRPVNVQIAQKRLPAI